MTQQVTANILMSIYGIPTIVLIIIYAMILAYITPNLKVSRHPCVQDN